MDVYEQLSNLAERLPRLEGLLETEEATKHALVLPFIAALGWESSDPTQVVPEYVADVAGLRGEKVDYALMRDGTPALLIECKQANAALSSRHLAQLSRYFTSTDAKIGVLTNGVTYQFFTDLAELNKMDERPFMTLDLRELDEERVKELQRLTHDGFDLNGMVDAARELSYLGGMRAALEQQLTAPDDELVRWLAKQVSNERLTERVHAEFAERTRKAFRSLINERVNEIVRLAAELDQSADDAIEPEPEEVEDDDPEIAEDEGIVTTVEEVEAWYVVKAILEGVVSADRVYMRDAKRYCAILLDNNNRLPLCRLHFGKHKKAIGLFDVEKKETRHTIGSLDDIYRHSEQIRVIARHWNERGE